MLQNFAQTRSVFRNGFGQQQRHLRQRSPAFKVESGKRPSRNRPRIRPSNRNDQTSVSRPSGQGNLLRMRAGTRSSRTKCRRRFNSNFVERKKSTERNERFEEEIRAFEFR